MIDRADNKLLKLLLIATFFCVESMHVLYGAVKKILKYFIDSHPLIKCKDMNNNERNCLQLVFLL